jgi:hypothetical protein
MKKLSDSIRQIKISSRKITKKPKTFQDKKKSKKFGKLLQEMKEKQTNKQNERFKLPCLSI